MKRIVILCLICLFFITGCSSNENIADLEKRIVQLQGDIDELKTKIDTLAKEKNDSSIVSNVISDVPSIEDNKTEEKTDQKDTYVEEENSVFYIDDMSAEEISNIVFDLLQDYPKEKDTLGILQDHYSKTYNLNKVYVEMVCNNYDRSSVRIHYDTNPTEIVHRDFISSVSYSFPYTLMKDDTIQYERQSKLNAISYIDFNLYGNYDKAIEIRDMILEKEQSIFDSPKIKEFVDGSQNFGQYIVTNSGEYSEQSKVTFQYDKQSDYYTFTIERTIKFNPD